MSPGELESDSLCIGGTMARAGNVRGQTLIIFLFILMFASVGIFVTFYSPAKQKIPNDRATARVFALANEALIGYAVGCFDSNSGSCVSPVATTARPGQLPCPDTDNDGVAQAWSSGECPSYIGRLPWKTLGIEQLRDGVGEPLWYAVSRDYARDPASCGSSCPVYPDAAGTLTVAGAEAVAIVFAAGLVVEGQSRIAANQNNASQYLDEGNADGDTAYVVEGTSFNDQLYPLTREPLFRVVNKRVARQLRKVLEDYRDDTGYYPRANSYTTPSNGDCNNSLYSGRLPTNPTTCSYGLLPMQGWGSNMPSWFAANSWNRVTHYAVASACSTFSILSLNLLQLTCELLGVDLFNILGLGNSPMVVNDVTGNARTVIIVTGPATGAQARSCTTAANCLEDADNNNGGTNGSAPFTRPSSYPTSNDAMAVTCASSAASCVDP